MRNDAEAATGPVWAKRGDLRCTRIGNLLRHWCLDELPQLFNVLNGDMSLVGPRPERPFFVQQFSQQVAGYNQRHTVPPGITGWAQINGWRGDSSLEKRVEFDLFYVRNWSLRFNLRILLLTPLRVLVDESGS
ncbi:MAG: sugar transferase [Pirellulales bacterium]